MLKGLENQEILNTMAQEEFISFMSPKNLRDSLKSSRYRKLLDPTGRKIVEGKMLSRIVSSRAWKKMKKTKKLNKLDKHISAMTEFLIKAFTDRLLSNIALPVPIEELGYQLGIIVYEEAPINESISTTLSLTPVAKDATCTKSEEDLQFDFVKFRQEFNKRKVE